MYLKKKKKQNWDLNLRWVKEVQDPGFEQEQNL